MVGYATRLDSKVSRQTRLTVITHGVFLSRIEADPELSNVSAVLFDAVHERTSTMISRLRSRSMQQVHFAPICVCLRCRQHLIPSDCGSYLGEAPVIVSEGKSFPLEVQYAGRDPGVPIETQMAKAIRTALKDNDGSLLAFLPGVAEIERTAEALGTLAPNVELQRLHGAIDGDAQRAALAPPPQGMRKVILSTSIAETSVTLDDVRIVVDSGLARRPRYDRDAGLTRLVTERASRFSVTQRSGRAARQASGIAIRLWDEASNASLLPTRPSQKFRGRSFELASKLNSVG